MSVNHWSMETGDDKVNHRGYRSSHAYGTGITARDWNMHSIIFNLHIMYIHTYVHVHVHMYIHTYIHTFIHTYCTCYPPNCGEHVQYRKEVKVVEGRPHPQKLNSKLISYWYHGGTSTLPWLTGFNMQLVSLQTIQVWRQKGYISQDNIKKLYMSVLRPLNLYWDHEYKIFPSHPCIYM